LGTAHLVLELLTVDALSAHAVAMGEVAALNHEVGDDTVERSSFKVQGLSRGPFALLASAQSAAKVKPCGLAHEGCSHVALPHKQGELIAQTVVLTGSFQQS